MRNVTPIVLGLVCWSLWGQAARAQNVPPTETDRLRAEVSELRQVVAQLTQRLQTLETQLVQNRPETPLRLAAFAEPAPESADAAPRLMPTLGQVGESWQKGEEQAEARARLLYSGVEAGMQLDRLEHCQRWGEAVRPSSGMEAGSQLNELEHRQLWQDAIRQDILKPKSPE